jgi:hypothetical protein
MIGFPIKTADFIEKLKARFPNDPTKKHDLEEGVAFLYRSLDRQISKGTGLLSYNGLLLATLNIISASSNHPTAITLGRGTALLAALLVLPLLWVHWGKAVDYASAEADLKSTVSTLRWRTWLNSCSIILSGATTFLAAYALGLIPKCW